MKQKYAVIYCRVSTQKQSGEGESLAVQEKICRKLAEQRNIKIIPQNKVFKEGISGSGEGQRIVFDRMMEFVEKHKDKIDNLIIRDIDRLTRGGSGDYENIKLKLWGWGIDIVDTLGLIQPQVNTLEHLGVEFSWSKYSSSDTAEKLRADVAKDERRNILTRVIGAEIELVREGYHVGVPNDGFKNKRVYIEGGRKRIIQVPDEDRAVFYRDMFNLRASGQYSDKEIVQKINALGYKSRIKRKWNREKTRVIGQKGGKPLTVKQLQSVIQRPIYCGIVCHKWTGYKPIKAQYDGLVSIDTFNKANKGKVYIDEQDDKLEILFDYYPTKVIRRRSRSNPLFPYKFILCPHCGKPFLGSSPKGKSGQGFPTYHCARNHKYFGVSKKDFEAKVKSCIAGVQVDEESYKYFKQGLVAVWEKRKSQIIVSHQKSAQTVKDLEQKKDEYLEAFSSTNNETIKKGLEKKIEDIEASLKEARKESIQNDISEKEFESFLKYSDYIIEHFEEMLIESEEIEKKQALFELVFEQMPNYQEIANGTPNLSLIFEYSCHQKQAESVLVAPTGIEPVFTG